jgi:peptide/nickel transport system substrate-binding protein
MKKFMLPTLTLTIGLTLAACGNSDDVAEDTTTNESEVAAETSAANQELNWALAVDPDGLDPHMTTAASTFQISNNIYDTLVKVTPEGEYVPGLAEDWELSEDGQTITFYLEEDVLFHDGSDFNADDVVYSFERLQSDSSARSADYAGLTEYSAVDDYTVEFVTDELDVNLLGKFAYPWAAIVPEGADDELTNNPIGTGPYVLENWVPQQNLTLTKNEDYWGEPAHIQTVNFRSMPDTTSQITSMLAGELDVIGITGDLVDQFEGQDGFEIMEEPANALQLMAFNTEHEALADERVRQAITLAVDKDALIDTVWYGYGQKIGSHYPPILRGYVDHSDSLSYDPDAALELLEEAGYPNGEGLELDMYLPSAYPAYVSAGQVIADYLTDIGITVNIQNVEWAVWLSDIYTARNYDLTVTGHTGRLDPYSLLARYHTDSPENYMNYSNERVDELLENVQVEQDEAAREEIYQEIQDILAEEVPGFYIQSPIGLRVKKDNLEGLETYPIDIIELKDIQFVE